MQRRHAAAIATLVTITAIAGGVAVSRSATFGLVSTSAPAPAAPATVDGSLADRVAAADELDAQLDTALSASVREQRTPPALAAARASQPALAAPRPAPVRVAARVAPQPAAATAAQTRGSDDDRDWRGEDDEHDAFEDDGDDHGGEVDRDEREEAGDDHGEWEDD